MDCSTPGFPVLHYLPEFAQTNVPQVSDAIQPSQVPVVYAFCQYYIMICAGDL